MKIPKTMKLGIQARSFKLDPASVNVEQRTVEVSFSSEEPVNMGWGIEILGHKKGEIDLSYINGRGAVCDGHNYEWAPAPQIGVVDKAWVEASRGKAILRFGPATVDEAEEKWQMVQAGVCQNVSMLYDVREIKLVKADKATGKGTYRATRWVPLTIDFVVIPADFTVGVGRAKNEATRDVPVIGGETMETCEVCGKPLDECICGKEDTPAAAAAKRGARSAAAGGAPPTRSQNQDGGGVATAVLEEARSGETDRASQILALAEQWVGKLPAARELAHKHVREKTPVSTFQGILLEELKKGPDAAIRPVPENAGDIGMSSRDLDRFSVLRLINAATDPENPQAQRAAAFELECSGEYQTRALKMGIKKEVRGLSIPPEVMRDPVITNERQREARQRGRTEGRAFSFSEGDPSGGGYLVGTTVLIEGMIDYLWKRIVVSPMIQRFTGLIGNVLLPKQTGEPSVYWIQEDGTPTIVVGDGIFGQVPLVAKTVGAKAGLTRKLLLQTSLDVEAFARKMLATKYGEELERVLIVGGGIGGINGPGEPLGIFNTPNIGSVSFAGLGSGAIQRSGCVQLWTKVAGQNADVANMAYVTNALVAGQAAMIPAIAGSAYPVFVMNDQGRIFNYPVLVTNHVPATFGVSGARSGIIFGDYSQMAVGTWGGIDVILDRISSDSGQVIVKMFLDVDTACLHAQSFAAGIDIDPTQIA